MRTNAYLRKQVAIMAENDEHVIQIPIFTPYDGGEQL